MNEFNETMKRLIKKNGHQNETIAKRMGITQTDLLKILRGETPITEKIILSFCEAIDIAPNELFGYEKNK